MRLWHIDLLQHLPKSQLSGQHRECCALRGLGWGRKHSTVDYVFEYDYSKLFQYHLKVMEITLERYPETAINLDWFNHNYRGQKIGFVDPLQNHVIENDAIYYEHDTEYYIACCDNLIAKFKEYYRKTGKFKWLLYIKKFISLKNNKVHKLMHARA